MKLHNKISNKAINVLIIAVFIIVYSDNAFSQKKRDADERFKEARELAFDGYRSAAIDSSESILIGHPNYYDVRVFMARVLAWDKNYDESIKNLQIVLEEKRDHREAINTLIDVYSWSGNYDFALKYADYGLTFYSSYADFLIKKAKALQHLEQPEEAALVIRQLLNLYPSNTEGLKLESLLSDAALLNEIKVYYRTDLFDSESPWHLSYMEYARRVNFGTLILRMNYANRFNKGGFQIESDGYINIRSGTYSYVNAGYSGSSIFPKIRLGIEPYQMLPYAFEISLGLRYLEFNSSVVRIFTGSVGKYLGNFWISYRFYLTPKPERTGFTSALYIRRYFSNVDNFITLRLGVGLVSYSEIEDEQFSGISSKGAAFEFQFGLSDLTYIRGEINYGNHEFYKGRYRNRYGFKLGFQQRF